MRTFKISMAILMYFCVLFLTMSSIGLDYFLDLPSFVFVLGVGISHALCSSNNFHEAFDELSKGSVLGGWLGTLIGLIALSSNPSTENGVGTVFWLGDGEAFAEMLTPLLYGYVISGLCHLILLSNRKQT